MSCILPTPKRQLFRVLRRREVANVPTDERHVWFERSDRQRRPRRHAGLRAGAHGGHAAIYGRHHRHAEGAELTHANLYVNAMQVGRWFHSCEPGQERVLGVLPLFHIFGMATVMNVGLLFGAEMILLPRFEIDQLMQTIHRKRPTIFPGRADIVRGDDAL